MASPSASQYPSAPVLNHSNLETFIVPEDSMKMQPSPVQCLPQNSFPLNSNSMGTNSVRHTDGNNMEATLQSGIVTKNAAMLPSMPQIDRKSPTLLPDISKDYNLSPTIAKKSALLDRSALELPSKTMNNLEASTSSMDREKMEPRLMPQSDLNNASEAKTTMGVVLTCHDRLETALTPTNIIEYKTMGNIDCKNMDGLPKQLAESTLYSMPKSNMVSQTSLPQNVMSRSTKAAPLNKMEFSSPAGQLDSVNENPIKYVDIINSSECPVMPKNNMDSASLVHKVTKNGDSIANLGLKLLLMDKNCIEGSKRIEEAVPKPNHLDLPLSSMDTLSSGAKIQTEPRAKSSSKSPSVEKMGKTPTRNTSASLSTSYNRVKGCDSTSKRMTESPTKPKIIAKSPSRDKSDKRLFRYSIGGLPGSGMHQIKMEDEASVPKSTMALPSKPKSITKSPLMDKMTLRSTGDMSSTPQYKMATESSMAKANVVAPSKPKTISKCSSFDRSPAKNPSELSVTPQNKIEDSTSLPKTNSASPPKPKTISKSLSINKTASKKSLKELSRLSEPSLVSALDRRASLRPPWRGGAWMPTRSQASPGLTQSGYIRRSESSMSVNAGLRSRPGSIRPATSLPHIPKTSSGSRRCLLVALRPTNLQQEKEKFFHSGFTYEPQFEYEEAELSAVLEKYRDGSDLFLQQAVAIMECVLRKFGSYETFEEATGGAILPKSQVWAAVRKYLQKEGCVGEVVVRLSDELLSQAVMVIENCRPTLTINLSGARQFWLEGMLRHEIGTHYLRGVNNSLQPWSSAEHRKILDLKGVNPTEEGLASLHSVLLRKQPFLWRAALLYYTVHHASNMSFSRLFHHIQKFVSSPDVRWEYCLRAKRGQCDTSQPGCFSKDQVYLDGILRILRHRRSIDFQLLTALGKVSFEDVERLRSLAVLSRTRIPHFMVDTDKYLSQLDHIVSVNELSDGELERLLP
ncbi:uncharacterized protein [Eucyclogobius newberryi]|uniref:uncharacterized protein isoform X1 n=1 Tax=Eucyclogobius newberryi TaxID=166745 RepID=UPI003B5A894C